MGSLGRIALWILAGIGGVIVVRKWGPPLYSKIKEKALSAGSTVKQLTSGSGLKLVACTAGTNPAGGDREAKSGVQSSPFFRWCYLVKNGDSAGAISEKIVGDSARYQEILVANPTIPKKGVMGDVVGNTAWDFAEGSLAEGTKVLIPQVWNSHIDQLGNAKGGYLPFPPDSRMIVETSGEVIEEEDAIILPPAQSSDGFDYSGAE